MMDARKFRILQAIIDDYILTAIPALVYGSHQVYSLNTEENTNTDENNISYEGDIFADITKNDNINIINDQNITDEMIVNEITEGLGLVRPPRSIVFDLCTSYKFV